MYMAAEQGDVAAQYNLGIAYANGAGTKRDTSHRSSGSAAPPIRRGARPVQSRRHLSARPRGAPGLCRVRQMVSPGGTGGEPRAELEIGLKFAEGQGVPGNWFRRTSG